jgi:hypothetical protein
MVGDFDLRAAHRELDAMLGRFLVAAGAGALADARTEITGFDEALRRHTADEEANLFPPPPARKLLPENEDEEPALARLSRELRLEHVQIRELSGMMRRRLEEGDLDGARRLFGNLARRWDAHTAREELAFPPRSPD